MQQTELISDDALIGLSVAIVRRAMGDYERALRKSKKNVAAQSNAEALEKWFLSEYGQLLSFYHGAEIISFCKSNVANNRHRWRGRKPL